MKVIMLSLAVVTILGVAQSAPAAHRVESGDQRACYYLEFTGDAAPLIDKVIRGMRLEETLRIQKKRTIGTEFASLLGGKRRDLEALVAKIPRSKLVRAEPVASLRIEGLYRKDNSSTGMVSQADYLTPVADSQSYIRMAMDTPWVVLGSAASAAHWVRVSVPSDGTVLFDRSSQGWKLDIPK